MDSFNTLRQRIPSKINENEDANESRVLDDQEQEELIQDLRRQNTDSNKHYILGADIIILLSFILHLMYLLNQSKVSPLFKLIPSSPSTPAFPLASLFTLINLFVHLNLYGLLHPEWIRTFLDESQPYALSLLSYSLSYAITCVAPCLCIFMGLSEWQTLVWWLLTPAVVYVAQSIHEATARGDRNIVELEAMRYSAPGA